MCHRCWTRDPGRPLRRADNLIAALDPAPEWLRSFAEFAAARHCVQGTCVMLGDLGRLLHDGQPTYPQALLERARQPGRSPGPLARTLDEFFVDQHLAFGLGQASLLASGRRQRRIAQVPDGLREQVGLFVDYLVRSQERARRTGTRPRSDGTIEATLANLRTFAVFAVEERRKTAWSAVQVGDVEAFLRLQPANRPRRLGSLRQYFRWARTQKVVLVDPTRDLPAPRHRAFHGQTLTTSEQRGLFQRWTSDGSGVHPHEVFVGIMALLHAASISELRMLRVDDIDERSHSLRLGRRPHPVPLDPVSDSALRRCLEYRDSWATANPHVIVTKATKTRSTPASSPYMTHILDRCGVCPRTLRSTRIVDLVIGLDPRVAGAALGMHPEGLVSYLADSVDRDRLPDDRSS